jgi:hypothetical protein
MGCLVGEDFIFSGEWQPREVLGHPNCLKIHARGSVLRLPEGIPRQHFREQGREPGGLVAFQFGSGSKRGCRFWVAHDLLRR